MESKLPPSSSSLELTISFPPLSGDGGGRMKDIDINRMPEDEGDDHQHQHYNYYQVGGGSSRKFRLSKPQSLLLEDCFQLNPSLNPKHKHELAMKLQLTTRQVEVWFQNRRARSKLRQTEKECENLKKWFNSLTYENRCLKKELAELRESKTEVGPTFLFPNTTEPLHASALSSICPRCHLITDSDVPSSF